MSLFHSILLGLQKKILSSHANLVDIANVISTTIGTKITPNQIRVQKNTLYITAPAIIKMSVNLKRQVLVQQLQKGGYNITTIV